MMENRDKNTNLVKLYFSTSGNFSSMVSNQIKTTVKLTGVSDLGQFGGHLACSAPSSKANLKNFQ